MWDRNDLALLESEKLERLPVMLTPAEAMDILHVGKNTIYRLLASGALQGIRIGRSWRISGDALEYFMLGVPDDKLR